eukprot:206535_1
MYNDLFALHHGYFEVIKEKSKHINNLWEVERIKFVIEQGLFPYQYQFNEAIIIVQKLFNVQRTKNEILGICQSLKDDVFNRWLFECLNAEQINILTVKQRVRLFYDHSPALNLPWTVVKKFIMTRYFIEPLDINIRNATGWKLKQNDEWINRPYKAHDSKYDPHFLLQYADIDTNIT